MTYAGALYPGLYFPSAAAPVVLPEYHDFISAIERQVEGDLILCRTAEGTIQLTRGVAVETAVENSLTFSVRVLEDELFAVDIER